MDLDAQDKKERELDDLIQVIRNEVLDLKMDKLAVKDLECELIRSLACRLLKFLMNVERLLFKLFLKVKEIAFKVSSTDQSIYLQALEADGLQLENEETKVSQGMATEELKALRELVLFCNQDGSIWHTVSCNGVFLQVDNQFQSSKDVLGPFYKQGEDAFLNYQKRFDLYKCNQRLKLQTFQNQVMNKTFQVNLNFFDETL